MMRFAVFCFLLVVGCYGDVRDPRWFNRQTRIVTKVLKLQQVITESTPSSCVVVQTSLPPCRHLRGLPIQPSAPTRILPTAAPNIPKSPPEQNWKPMMQPSDLIPPPTATPPLKLKEPITVSPSAEWDWDFFNLRPKDVTVTKTVKEIFTTKYYDPNTVVTFSVKGCRPSRLPFDLPECKITELVPEPIPERNVIVMAPVQFVPEHVINPVKVATITEKPAEEPKKEE